MTPTNIDALRTRLRDLRRDALQQLTITTGDGLDDGLLCLVADVGAALAPLDAEAADGFRHKYARARTREAEPQARSRSHSPRRPEPAPARRAGSDTIRKRFAYLSRGR